MYDRLKLLFTIIALTTNIMLTAASATIETQVVAG